MTVFYGNYKQASKNYRQEIQKVLKLVLIIFRYTNQEDISMSERRRFGKNRITATAGVGLSVLLLAGCTSGESQHVEPTPSASDQYKTPLPFESDKSIPDICGNGEVDLSDEEIQQTLNDTVATVSDLIYKMTYVEDSIVTDSRNNKLLLKPDAIEVDGKKVSTVTLWTDYQGDNECSGQITFFPDDESNLYVSFGDVITVVYTITINDNGIITVSGYDDSKKTHWALKGQELEDFATAFREYSKNVNGNFGELLPDVSLEDTEEPTDTIDAQLQYIFLMNCKIFGLQDFKYQVQI